MRKIGLSDNIRRVVRVNPDATVGAVVGRNLTLEDGTVVTAEMLFGDGEGQSDSDPGFTYWRLIQEVPPNLRALALLNGQGFAFRDQDGSWRLRRVGRTIANFAFGDAGPAPVYTAPQPLMVVLCRVVVEEGFNGDGAAISIGTAADPELVHAAADNDPTTESGYESTPSVTLAAGDTLLATIVPGAGATAGAGQIILDTVPLEGI